MFRVCIGITFMLRPTFSGFIWVLHACRCRHVKGFLLVLHARRCRHFQDSCLYYMHVCGAMLRVCNGITCMSGLTFPCYRYYMHVGAAIFRVCIGITCMSGPTFSGFVPLLHTCMCRHFQGLYRYYLHVGADT